MGKFLTDAVRNLLRIATWPADLGPSLLGLVSHDALLVPMIFAGAADMDLTVALLYAVAAVQCCHQLTAAIDAQHFALDRQPYAIGLQKLIDGGNVRAVPGDDVGRRWGASTHDAQAVAVEHQDIAEIEFRIQTDANQAQPVTGLVCPSKVIAQESFDFSGIVTGPLNARKLHARYPIR